jgi:hypothetical protein
VEAGAAEVAAVEGALEAEAVVVDALEAAVPAENGNAFRKLIQLKTALECANRYSLGISSIS